MQGFTLTQDTVFMQFMTQIRCMMSFRLIITETNIVTKDSLKTRHERLSHLNVKSIKLM